MRHWRSCNPCRALSGSILVHLADLKLRPESVWFNKAFDLALLTRPRSADAQRIYIG